MKNSKKTLFAVFFLLFVGNFLRSQQTTTWTTVSATVWESITSDGLVRVECRVAAGVSILGPETMGCTSAATYSDPAVFGSSSLEISASSFSSGTLEFHFFDADTNVPINIEQPVVHADKIGTFAIVVLVGKAATANFNLTSGTWSELSSNGPIFASNATTFNIDTNALIIATGGECGSGVNPGAGGGSMQLDNTVGSINMSVNVTGGLLSTPDEVEFVLTNLFYDPCTYGALAGTVTINDPDADGLNNLCDLDDDNDGILDTDEQSCDLMGICTFIDTDGDGKFDHLDLDSDEDGCSDADEAYAITNADGNDDGIYGIGNPVIDSNGLVTIAGVSGTSYNTIPATIAGGQNTFQEGVTITIATPPSDQQVCEGSDATFSAVATTAVVPTTPVTSANTIVTYLWQESSDGTNYTDISGESGSVASGAVVSLVIPNATLSLDGNFYKVIVTNEANICSEEATAVLNITEAPDAGINGTLTICQGDTVTDVQLFAELGGTPDAGGTWSPALAGAGTYTYTVSATTPCTTDATSEVVVSEQEAPDAGTNGTLTICEGDTVTTTQLFNALGGTPDNGGTWSPALAGAGTYTYTVSAIAPCTTDATSEVVVSQQAAPDAGTNGTLTICEGETVTGTQLFAELGGTPDTSGSWSPALAGAGTYTYTVTAIAPCTTDATSEVIVSEQSVPDAGTNGTLTICQGDTVTDAQLFAELGGTPDASGTWSPALAGAGTYTYTVSAIAPCTTDATSEVVVSQQVAPDAGTNGTLTICEGDTVTTTQLFNALGGTPDNGGTWSPALAGAGTYTYTVSAIAPCTTDATSEVVVSEQAAPDAGTNGTLTICEGDTVTATQLFNALGGSPDSGGNWSPVLAGAGTYTYTVTAIAPCTTDATSEVIVSEQSVPDAGTNGTLTICEGETVTDAQLLAELGGTPDAGGTWSPALAGAGTYTYTVSAIAPCTTDATSEVVVSEQAAPDAGTNGTLTICEGDTVTATQLFNALGGSPDSGGNWSPVLAGAGTYTYTVTAIAPCTTDATSEVILSEQSVPDAGTNGTLTICEGETVTDAQLLAELGGTPDAGGTWSPALAGAGTYTYTVSAIAPCTTDATSEVVVSQQLAPDAGTNGTLTICEGDTVTATQLFNTLGGTPDPGGNWSPALAGAGTYTYTVSAIAPCTNDATSEVIVSEQVASDAGTNGTLTICEGDTVMVTQLFNALGGSPDAGGKWSPVLAGAVTYTYIVTATAPCTADATAEVEVTEQVAPDAGTNGTLNICEGDTVTTAQLIAELGGTPDAGGTWSPARAGAGTYTYTVSAIAPCTTDATSEVVVSQQVAPDAGTNGTLTICEGDTVTTTQLFSELGGTPHAGGSWSPALTGAGTYTYTVTATAPCTADATAEVEVTEQVAPDAGTNGTLTICEGDTVTDAQLFSELGGTPDVGGTWSPSLAGAGTYTYTLGGTVCPETSTTVTVIEEVRPNAGSNTSLEICAGTTVTQLQLFSILGTNDNSGTWNPNPEGGDEGTYTYTVAGTICIDASATVTVSISMLDSDGDTVTDCDEDVHGTDPFNDCESIGGRPLPTSDCDNDRLTEEEEAMLGTNPLNPDTDGDGVLDGQEVTDATNPLDICDFLVESQTATPTNMWNTTDCDSDDLTNQDELNLGTNPTNPDTDGDTIRDGQEVLDMTDPLDPCDSKGGTPPLGASCEIYIENDMVTPGDIMNGNFEIINIHLFPDNTVEIHNRWGQLVWETKVYDNRNNAFDGVTKGKLAILENQKLPSGVYFYKVKYVANGLDKILSGYLYINK